MTTTSHTPVAEADAPLIMDLLRHGTRELHTLAEQQPFQRTLAKGRLPRERYIQWLMQMRLIHQALEEALHSHRAHPTIASVLQPHHQHARRIEADLTFLVGPSALSGQASTLPAVEMVREAIRTASSLAPTALLGFLYVLEGSTNGGRFLAMAVRRAYTLEGQDGTRYLDPYGENHPARWSQFKDSMNAAHLSPSDRERIHDAACAMFQAVIDLSRQLDESDQVGVSTPARSR